MAVVQSLPWHVMIASWRTSAATSLASDSGAASRPIEGPLPPAADVEKNVGST